MQISFFAFDHLCRVLAALTVLPTRVFFNNEKSILYSDWVSRDSRGTRKRGISRLNFVTNREVETQIQIDIEFMNYKF